MKNLRAAEDPNRPLTALEKAFVEEITRMDEGRPKTNVEAYRRIANTQNENKKVVGNRASQMFRKPAVQRAIQQTRETQEALQREIWQTNFQMIEKALWEEANNADRSADRISALKTLATMQPEEKKERDSLDSLTREELIDRCEQLLEEMLGGAIDVTPSGSDISQDRSRLISSSSNSEEKESSDSSDSSSIIIEAEAAEVTG